MKNMKNTLFFKNTFFLEYTYRILRNKRPPPNKRPPFLIDITNYKELKEKSEVFGEINAK